MQKSNDSLSARRAYIGSLEVEPLKAALIVPARYTRSMMEDLALEFFLMLIRARTGPIHYVCAL